jgi:hypothetical protein
MGKHENKLNQSIVEGHDLLQIKGYIDKIANINFQCKARPTALYTAVMDNNVQVAELLLQRGADMMIAPLKKSYHNESECPLLMAFKQGESHEDMQFVLLCHLSAGRRDQLDSVARKNVVRVAQYAMMYCSTRIFFAAEKMKTEMIDVNPTGFSPLMFTLIHVGLYEGNLNTCIKILERVEQILDTDSTTVWQRYYSSKIANRGTKPPFTGGTALGSLLFVVLKDRQNRCTEYEEYLAGVERGKTRMAQYMPATDPHHNGMVQFAIEREAQQKCIHDKNLAMMCYLANVFAPCLFAKMLPPMRVALGMSTHARLGNQHGCSLGQLNADIMNSIFNELVRGIVATPEEYKFMLF